MLITMQVFAHFETPFHVGGGVTGESAALKPLLKDEAGRPYVPGSALKGVLRHEAERIVRTLAGDRIVVCRAPRAEVMCPQWPVFGEFCPICRTFGSPARPSPFYFGDMRVEGGSVDEEIIKKTTLRYGVGVSRYRGAATEQILYATEAAVTAPLLELRGDIQGNVSGEDGDRCLALLLAAINALRMLGGGRSRGLGWLTLEVENPPLSAEQIEEGVRQWLTINH